MPYVIEWTSEAEPVPFAPPRCTSCVTQRPTRKSAERVFAEPIEAPFVRVRLFHEDRHGRKTALAERAAIVATR